MSNEHIEIARRLYQAMRDRGATATLEFATSDVELELSPPMPRARYSGHEEIRDFLAEWDVIFGEYRLEPEEFIATPDRIVVLARFSGQGTGGGVPIDIPVAHIWTFRGEKISHAHFFTDCAEALEVAGVPR